MKDWFPDLPRHHYGAILSDNPWHFETWGEGGNRNVTSKYPTMSIEEMCSMPVAELAADDCVLFMWVVWPKLFEALPIIQAWGFEYKTCAFCWTKADISQYDLFRNDADGQVGLGYWTRANTEACLLATKGKPKRLNADVRQPIIEPRREHSRKPDCLYDRIERLVVGPYVELFARTQRPGWSCWGNETEKFVHGQTSELVTPCAQSQLPIIRDAESAVEERRFKY